MPPRQKKPKRTDREPSLAEIRASAAALFELDERRKRKVAQTSLPTSSMDSDDEDTAASLRYDLCLRAEGSNGILRFTNFTPREFDSLWGSIEGYVAEHWNVGKGKKSKHSGKDVFFMTVCALKHCGKWDTVSQIFRILPSTFQKMVRGFLMAVGPHLYEIYVESLSARATMSRLTLSGEHFPCARYATDVAFQQAYRPAGSHSAVISYFSGKHHLYGYKVEVSVLPTGQALNCTPHARGSVSDMTIFRENDAYHVRALRKCPDETQLTDDGPMHDVYPHDWAVLVDKGYQGLGNDFRAIHPKRQTRLHPLTLEDSRQNDKISHDRVIVENYFGRMKTLWGVCADQWRWDEKSYDLFFRVCVALTNAHVRLRPLRAEEGDDYHRYEARLRNIGLSIKARDRALHQGSGSGESLAWQRVRASMWMNPPKLDRRTDRMKKRSCRLTTTNASHLRSTASN